MHDPSVSMRYRSSHYFAFTAQPCTQKDNIMMGALASQATVPFIKLQYAYKCPLPLSKIKCSKAGHENPQKPAGGKRRERAPPTKAMVPPTGF